MSGFKAILLIILILCALATSISRNLLTSVVIFMSYSLVMCIIWILLESPDLAITEAAVGAGVTSVLFFITLKKIHAMDLRRNAAEEDEAEEEEHEQNQAGL
ncbi:MAG: DUF4040 domain-containing protein [Lachnospiraceae bacterium]|nr:DUF4040 domain-containing protein [Lachnospiraceae bacterium]